MTSPDLNQEKNLSDKELNFRKLEEKYERQLAQERAEKEQALQIAKEIQQKMQQPQDDDDDDSEPYVDHKKLNKKLSKFGEQTQKQTQQEIQKAVQQAIAEERRNSWLKNTPDFYETLKHAEKFAEKDPELAETILQMPDSFERQKLVYKTIKAMGIDKPEQKPASIQETIDKNRRSPYYQPSGVANSPYAGAGDFSPQGQKTAYEQLLKLKARIGQ
jgi:hypothetical protein